jgi:hypothetical protein
MQEVTGCQLLEGIGTNEESHEQQQAQAIEPHLPHEHSFAEGLPLELHQSAHSGVAAQGRAIGPHDGMEQRRGVRSLALGSTI